MVPPNWDHPKVMRTYGYRQEEGFQPMYDQRYEVAAREWKDGLAAWERGERPIYYDPEPSQPEPEFWEYNGAPPDREYYRPWLDEAATWFQVWETVSEGTPVSPPFETAAELIDYLVAHGDFWDQKRGDPGWRREAATSFVGTGWKPSMIVVQGGPDAGVYEARDGVPPLSSPN